MIVKILEIMETDSGTLYKWLGGIYGVPETGVASKITGDGEVSVGVMGWMNEDDRDSIYIPLSWP